MWWRPNRKTDEEKLMTFGKPMRNPSMSYAEVENLKKLIDRIPDAKTLQQQYGDEYCAIWEELNTIHLVEGPDAVLDIDRARLNKGTISVIDDYIRRNRVSRPRKKNPTTRTMRKAENNEHRTPRRSKPAVARPVLSRTGRNDSARTRVTDEGRFEQGLRRPSEMERAIHQETGKGYGVFYPGHPAIRGGRSGRGDW